METWKYGNMEGKETMEVPESQDVPQKSRFLLLDMF